MRRLITVYYSTGCSLCLLSMLFFILCGGYCNVSSAQETVSSGQAVTTQARQTEASAESSTVSPPSRSAPSVSSSAAADNIYDLKKCMILANKAHPDIAPARAELMEAAAMIREASAALFPKVNIRGGYHYNLDTPEWDDYQPKGADRPIDFQWSGQNVWRGDAGVDWPVFTWNRVQENRKGKELELAARKKDYIRVREQAISEAIESYWTLASAVEARRYLDITMRELSLFRDMARDDQRNGMPNAQEKDVMQISIDMDKMAAWRGTLDKWAASARQALAITIGKSVSQVNIVDHAVHYKPIRIKFSDCLAAAYSHRADLKAMSARIEEARLQIGVERKAILPTVSLFARGYVQDDDFDASQDLNGMVGVAVSGTIFDGFKSSARADQARARLAKLQADKYRLQQDIRQEVRDAYLSVRESFISLKAYRDARLRTLKKLDLVRQGYPLQITDVDDVLDAQVERRWRDAEFIFAKLRLMKSLARLNYACGASVYDFSQHSAS